MQYVYIATPVSRDAYTIPSHETILASIYLATQMTKGMVKVTMALLQCMNMALGC